MDTTQEWFDRLYEEHKPNMKKIAYRALENAETAEDIIQDVFLILLAKQRQVRTYKHPAGWLYITLRNQIGNELQRQIYRKTASLDAMKEPELPNTYDEPLTDAFPSGLNEKDQTILLLFYDRGFSYEEIAEYLHCSILTCRTKLCRAKNRLKELLLQKE